MSDGSAERCRFFLASGYLKLGGTIPEELIERMRALILRDLASRTPPLRVNGAGQACRLDGLVDRDPVFVTALRLPFILEALTALLGPDVEAVRFRHNHATLNAPGDIPVRLHRDVQQWTRPLVSVFLYLEDSTLENGCTQVVPGSHTLPYPGPQSGGGAGNWADEHPEFAPLIGQELPIPVSRGGVLLLNSLALHSVGPNLGKNTRVSATFACRSVDDLTIAPDDSAVRIAGSHKFRGNPKGPPQDSWFGSRAAANRRPLRGAEIARWSKRIGQPQFRVSVCA